MSQVEVSLNRKPPAGLSLKEKVQVGYPGARQKALGLLDEPPASGLSANKWKELGLESAAQTVESVHKLVYTSD